MHVEAMEGFTKMLAESGIDTSAEMVGLDVGGRNINGTVRHLLPNTRWVGLDIKPGRDVDIVADASTWVPDREYDIVISTELFEHTAVWREIAGTMAAACKPDGWVFITCASTGRAPHGAEGTVVVPPGEHYGNVAASDLAFELACYFTDVHVTYNPSPGDVYACAFASSI